MDSNAKWQRQVGILLSAPLMLLAAASPAQADEYITIETSSYEWVEETSPQADIASARPAVASFGPFRVVSSNEAELIGDIESNAPALFGKMLKSYPGIKRLVMVDIPGTTDDTANLALARIIRAKGIATHVPKGGSVRSGGVELFLAGAKRSAHPEAEFAVHSWMDSDGFEATDYGTNDPVHKSYIAYYREMGMSADKAKAFYQMTNSVSFNQARYLKTADIAAYIPVARLH